MADVWHTLFGVAGTHLFPFYVSFDICPKLPPFPYSLVTIASHFSIFPVKISYPSSINTTPMTTSLLMAALPRENKHTHAMSAKGCLTLLASRHVPFLLDVPWILLAFCYAHSLLKLLPTPFPPVTDLPDFERGSIFTCLAPQQTPFCSMDNTVIRPILIFIIWTPASQPLQQPARSVLEKQVVSRELGSGTETSISLLSVLSIF